MTDEQRQAEIARLQKLEKDSLIHHFDVRENDVVVTIVASFGQFNAASDAVSNVTARYVKQ